MPQYIDSYYLVESRKLEVLCNFFAKYFPLGGKELATDYPFPQFSNHPEKVYYSVKELLLHLENNPDFEYTIYFENKERSSEIKQITLQYTDDGKMIFGLSMYGNDPSSIKSIQLFKEIKSYLNSKMACVTIEEPPPINSNEFSSFCNERFVPDIESKFIS